MNAIVGMSNLVIQTEINGKNNIIMSVLSNNLLKFLLGVVNDILAISEINNSQLKFDYKFFNLYELLHNLLNVMQYQAKEKSLKIIFEPTQRHSKNHFMVIKLRLNQILYNLVGNALKFTEKGEVKIVVKTLSESNYFVQLKFVISDTGIGISPIKLTTIFESLPRKGNQNGVQKKQGLGIANCQKFSRTTRR